MKTQLVIKPGTASSLTPMNNRERTRRQTKEGTRGADWRKRAERLQSLGPTVGAHAGAALNATFHHT